MYIYKISKIKSNILNEGVDNKTLTIRSEKALSKNKLKSILNKRYNGVTDFVLEAFESNVDRLDKRVADREEEISQLRVLEQKRFRLQSEIKRLNQQLEHIEIQINEIRRNNADQIKFDAERNMDEIRSRKLR